MAVMIAFLYLYVTGWRQNRETKCKTFCLLRITSKHAIKINMKNMHYRRPTIQRKHRDLCSLQPNSNWKYLKQTNLLRTLKKRKRRDGTQPSITKKKKYQKKILKNFKQRTKNTVHVHLHRFSTKRQKRNLGTMRAPLVTTYLLMLYGTAAENQLPRKRFPESSVSSLILVGWCEEGLPATKKLAPTFPWIDNCLMVTKRDFFRNESVTMTKREIPSVATGLWSTLCCWEAAVYALD